MLLPLSLSPLISLYDVCTIFTNSLVFTKLDFDIVIATMPSRTTDSSTSWAPLEFMVDEMAAHGQPVAIFGHHAVLALVFLMVHVRGVVPIAVRGRFRWTSAAALSPILVGQFSQRPYCVVDGPWCRMGYHFCEKSEDAVLPRPVMQRSRTNRQNAPMRSTNPINTHSKP